MGRSIRFDLVTDARGYGRGMREAERFNKRFTGSITALQRTTSKGFKVNADTKKAESNFQQLEGAVKKFNVTALTLRNLTKLLKFPAIIAAGNALAGVFVSVAAEAVSLVSALSPLVGVIPAAGVGMLAFAQATGVLKLAFGGIGPALKQAGVDTKKFNEELKKLPPAQRQIVLAIVPFKQELIKLRGVAATGILPGFQVGLRALRPLFGVVQTAVRLTATELGGLIAAGGRLLGSGPFRADFARIARGNVTIIHLMGQAGLSLINVFRNIAVTAQPLAIWIAQMIKSWAAGLNEFFSTARGSGALTAFFERTKFVISTLVDAVGRFAHAWGPIFAIALPQGNRFLIMLRNGAAAFDRFTHSAHGAKIIKDIFAQSQIVMAAVGRLLVSIATNFSFLGKSISGSGIAAIIDKIATQGVPAFAKLARNTGGAFLTNLVQLGINLTRIFAIIGGNSGTLTSFVGALARISGALANILEKHPGLASFVTTIGAMAAIGSGTGLGAVASGFGRIAFQAPGILAMRQHTQALNATMGITTTSVVRGAARQVAAWVGLAAKAIASAVRIAAAWLISLGPIGLVIAAVAAVGIALFILWKKSQTFRNIVTGSFHAVGAAAQWLWNSAIGPAFRAIAAAAVWLYSHMIKPYFDSIKRIFEIIGHTASWLYRNAVAPAFAGIGKAGKDLWGAINWVKDRIVGAFQTLKRWGDWIFLNIKLAFLHIEDAALTMVEKITSFLSHIPGPIGRMFGKAHAEVVKFRGGVQGEIKTTQKAIDSLHDKNIALSASTALHFTKTFTQKDWVAARTAAGRMAKGGLVMGRGGPTSDSNLVRLSSGELVVPTKAVADVSTMAGPALAKHRVPGFAKGGMVGKLSENVGKTDIGQRGTGKILGDWAYKIFKAGITSIVGMGGTGGAAAGFTGGAASGNVIRLALAQARKMHASFKAALALIEAGIVESGLRNLNYGDRDSLGFLQQRPSQGWAHPRDISYAAWDFLRRAIPIQGRYGTAGALAQAVQRSAFPGRYDAVQAQAMRILHANGYQRGAWNVPRTGPAFLHRGEMVVPAGPAERVRRGAAGGTMNVTFNIYDATDPEKVGQVVVDHLNKIERERWFAERRGGRR